MSDKIIEMKNVNKWFGDFQVLKDINLDVNQKQKIVVCGPSGSGKSTLIRCINRLEEHQKGNIIVDGNELTEDTKNIVKSVFSSAAGAPPAGAAATGAAAVTPHFCSSCVESSAASTTVKLDNSSIILFRSAIIFCVPG